MTTLDNDFKQILSKNFHCKLCDYITSRKHNMTNHCLSAKHQKNLKNNDLTTLDNDFKQILSTNHKKYICLTCSRAYNDRAGLWRHKKKCSEPTTEEVFAQNDTKQLTQLVMKVVEQNQELTKQIVELSKNTGSNHHNMINSNNKFNLNLFLNETCKNAINITDFVTSLVVSVKDLEETARLGYSEGISKIFLDGLQQLDTCTRPIHCSDTKREILYIKDANKWLKEDSNNTLLIKAIKTIAHKNMKMIPEWIKQHPDYNDSESKTNDKYIKIVMNSMSGSTEEEQKKNINKIISNVAKEVFIEK